MAPCWSTARYESEAVPDVAAALATAGAWLREELKINPIAIGHRVVHGGPDYDRPVRVDQNVLARLERYISLAPLHQPYNLAPIRSILARFPDLPQVACFDTAFHRGHGALGRPLRDSAASLCRRRPALRLPRPLLRIYRQRLPQVAPEIAVEAGDRRPSGQRRLDVRARTVAAASKAAWDLRRSTGCRWARGPARSIPASCST